MGSKPSRSKTLSSVPNLPSSRCTSGNSLLSFPPPKVEPRSDIEEKLRSCREQRPTTNAFLRSATEAEFHEVVRLYLQNPVPEYEIHSVEVVQNPMLKRLFQASLALLQGKKDRLGTGVVPRWVIDSEVSARFQVYRRLDDLAAPFGDPKFPAIKLFPVWSLASTSARTSESQNESKLDTVLEFGYLSGISGGRGVSFSCEAEQAWRAFPSVLESDVLILSWVGASSVFPFLSGLERDRQLAAVSSTSTSSGVSQSSYDCFYGPISGISCVSSFSEVTILDPTQCLPCFAVKIRPVSGTTPATTLALTSPTSCCLSFEVRSPSSSPSSVQKEAEVCCGSGFKASEMAKHKLRELLHTLLERYDSMLQCNRRCTVQPSLVPGIPQVESIVVDPLPSHTTAAPMHLNACNVTAFSSVPPALSLTSAESEDYLV